MKKELNWAVIGTGVIANEMAQALQNGQKTLRCRQPHTGKSPCLPRPAPTSRRPCFYKMIWGRWLP